jgi:signal transduction histidine kinase
VSPPNPFRPVFRATTYRSLLFAAAAVPLAALTLAVLIAGWTTAAVLVITPLVVPVLVGFRGAVGLLARADAWLGRALLGTDARPAISSGGRGFWGSAKAVIVDAAFWQQQLYLVLRMTVGFAFAVGELSLIAAGLGAVFYPAYYRWSDLHFGSWQADTLPRSLLLVPAGLLALVVAAQLASLFGAVSRRVIRDLLRDRPGTASSPALARPGRRQALRIHALAVLGLGVGAVAVWALAGGGYFWPEWLLLPLGLSLAIHGWIEYTADWRWSAASPARPGLSIHAGVAAALCVFLTLIWALTSHGYFWPAWVVLPLAAAVVVHAVVARFRERGRLAERVRTLETTRADAVDARDAELRRIERDIHDGAQARLVALGMRLGMAEQKFASDPEGARLLVGEARAGVAEALRELRDLARGIYPPVLADRGLDAALTSLAKRSAIPVTVTVSLEGDLPQPVEAAAYFVAAEALANAGKHSQAEHVAIAATGRGGTLEVEIRDDGRGGADPNGSGLVGLRSRVQALDGSLAVSSPAGGPTTIRAELPCGS